MFDLNQRINEIAKPKGWKAIPLKYVYKRKKEFGDGSEDLLSIYRDHGVVPKNSRSDNFNKASDDLSKYQKVQPGDLVINKMKAWQGSVAISDFAGIISPAYFIYEPQVKVYSRYIHYLLRSEMYFSYYASISSGVRPNQWDLDPSLFERVNLLLPPFNEQMKIADELDRELAEIDEFIADQQRLQDLLQERLVSLTYDLATDASNPDRYETGHPFWKTLPKGWTLQKLGWHFRVGNGSTPLSTNEEYWSDDTDDIPWFNSSTVNQTIAERPSRYVTKKAMQECHLPKVPAGSLLMGMIGQGKTRGMVTKTGIEATLSQNVAYLTPMKNSRLDIDFALLALKAAYPELREINSGNGTTKGSLTCETIQQFRVPTPEFHQQLSLVSNFNKMKSKNTGLINLAKKLELLSEKKSSLVDQFINRR